MIKCGYCSRLWPDDAQDCTCGCTNPFGRKSYNGVLPVGQLLRAAFGQQTAGVDISTWQEVEPAGGTDFGKMSTLASFVFIKASQSTWRDNDFATFWNNSQGVLPRGAYHYFTWDASPRDQAAAFARYVGDTLDAGELPMVVDYECWNGVPERTIAASRLWEFTAHLKALTGRYPIIYTSPGYWLANGSTDASFLVCDLWIAHYYVTAPQIPLPWLRWHFWQYSAKGDGFAHGVESASIDLDWFNGTQAELEEYITGQDPEPEDVLFVVTSLVQDQRVRADHRTTAPEVGRLTRGADYAVVDFWAPSTGAECWVKLAYPSGWAAVVHGGRMYLTTA